MPLAITRRRFAIIGMVRAVLTTPPERRLLQLEDVVVEAGAATGRAQHRLADRRQAAVDQVALRAVQAIDRIDLSARDGADDVAVGPREACFTCTTLDAPDGRPTQAATLLLASNTFMTIAWYGHLRFKNRRRACGS